MTYDEAVSELGRMKRMGIGGSLKALRQTLAEDEDVVTLARANRSGDMKEPGVLAITDRRVIWASKMLGQAGTVDFRYDRISTVDCRKDGLKGYTLSLRTAGADLVLMSLDADYGTEIRSRSRRAPRKP